MCVCKFTLYIPCSKPEVPSLESVVADLSAGKAQKEAKEIKEKNLSLEKECVVYKSQLKVTAYIFAGEY